MRTTWLQGNQAHVGTVDGECCGALYRAHVDKTQRHSFLSVSSAQATGLVGLSISSAFPRLPSFSISHTTGGRACSSTYSLAVSAAAQDESRCEVRQLCPTRETLAFSRKVWQLQSLEVQGWPWSS